MPRYFIKVAYNGANYAGFQVQDNANSVQAEVEKALSIFFKTRFELTGSSRTDAGVHAHCNYFHFDSDVLPAKEMLNKAVYNLNAILPCDIVIRSIFEVSPSAHCRFDAVSRRYQYSLYQFKDPFLAGRAFYYPYPLDVELLNEAADLIKQYHDFTTFSKRNTQVKTFNCNIIYSRWEIEENSIVYTVEANRFLRGMVRGLVGTMLRVGTKRISIDKFRYVIESRNCTEADFSVPAAGLFLQKVNYPSGIIPGDEIHEQ